MTQRVAGYPEVFGGKKAGIIAKLGPVGYATGGFLVEAVEFGMRHIDWAAGGSSDNGLFFTSVRVIGANEDNTSKSSVLVQVYNAAGGQVAAATNLSGVTFRLFALGK